MCYNVVVRYMVYLLFEVSEMYESDTALQTCCFLGHREIREVEELKRQLYDKIVWLITKERVERFLFGSKSRFNSLCYELVTELKDIYPHIKRVYVRAEYPIVGEDYERYLLEGYEDTYYPASVCGAGRAAYVKRNVEMIERSCFCVFYYDEDYVTNGRKSGTKIAFDYAQKQRKKIYRFPLQDK